MAVDSYALTSVDLCRAYLGWGAQDGTLPALSIWNHPAASQTSATVERNDQAGDYLSLTVVGGVNEGVTNINLTAAASDTLTELVTVIHAADIGYIVRLLGPGDAASADLLVMPPTDCEENTNRVTLFMSTDYVLEKLIDAALAYVEGVCGRIFMSRSLVEYHNGDGGKELFLKERPVTDVTRVAVGRVNGIEVKCALSGAVAGTASVTGTSVVLKSYAATTTTNTLTFTANTTLTAMATAITALSGWTGTVATGADGGAPSADLCETYGHDCLEHSYYLEAPDNRSQDYSIDETLGIVRHVGRWPNGARNIRVDYTAGYATAPADLQDASTQMVVAAYRATERSLGLESEKIGDYAWKRATTPGSVDAAIAAAALDHRATLQRYVQPRCY